MIEDIEQGDWVFDRWGTMIPVVSTSSRNYEGELIIIKPKYAFPIEVTPEHRILTAQFVNRKGEVVSRRRAVARSKAKKSVKYRIKFEWKEAKDLNGDELLVLPKIEWRTDFSDPELAVIVGWYLAEGHLAKSGNCVYFTLSKNELQEAEMIKQLILKRFSGTVTIKDRGNSIRVSAVVPDLREYLKRCNTGAANKEIPAEFFDADYETTKALIDALWRGDGSISEIDGSVKKTIYTVSKRLAIGVYYLLQKLGYMPYVYCHKQKPSKTSDGRIISPKLPIFAVSWNPNPKKKMWYDAGAFYLVPFSKETKTAKTKVYDLTTNGEFAAGIIVHNCGCEVEPKEIPKVLSIIRSL